jgi:hypothetical protein
MTQPVGLDGELTKIPRVRESQAAKSRSGSSRQPPPGSASSETSRGSPPITLTAAAMLGHTGARMTRLSPSSISAWAISISPVMPELDTTTRSAATGRWCKPVRYSAIAARSSGRPAL